MARTRDSTRARHSRRWDILLVVSLGGAIGSVGRWAVGQALPHRSGQFPWSTFIENTSGALALGFLMVLMLELWPSQRYLRPFLGVGVLGGYTTFSTYTLDIRELVAAGAGVRAVLYLVGSLAGGLLAAWIGVLLGRLVVVGRERRRRREGKLVPEDSNQVTVRRGT